MKTAVNILFVTFLTIAIVGGFLVCASPVLSLYLPAGYGIAAMFSGFVAMVVGGCAAFAIDANT